MQRTRTLGKIVVPGVALVLRRGAVVSKVAGNGKYKDQGCADPEGACGGYGVRKGVKEEGEM